MSIQVLGDRMATQVEKLYRLAGAPVDIVAESEGTLGLYAMLARHPHLPVRSVVLLSPIVQPGQLARPGMVPAPR
jgi:alpha-beta hydrolase superfamily lysophospholipase